MLGVKIWSSLLIFAAIQAVLALPPPMGDADLHIGRDLIIRSAPDTDVVPRSEIQHVSPVGSVNAVVPLGHEGVQPAHQDATVAVSTKGTLHDLGARSSIGAELGRRTDWGLYDNDRCLGGWWTCGSSAFMLPGRNKKDGKLVQDPACLNHYKNKFEKFTNHWTCPFHEVE